MSEQAIRNGGKAIFEQRCENAPVTIIMEISTEEDLKIWKNKVSEAIKHIENLK